MEREVRANLVYRMFTRIDAGDVPDAKTILKIARALGPEVIEQLHRQVVEVEKRAGVTHGRRFRIDTTVVATNVHYPTDSTLLGDGVRVLTRTLQRASAAFGGSLQADSQSAAQCDAAHADHWVRGAIAKDPGGHGQELSDPDGDHARRVA